MRVDAVDRNPLRPAGAAVNEADRVERQAQDLRQEPHQGFIRASIHRRRRQPDSQHTIVPPR